jgi:hypothetical protein
MAGGLMQLVAYGAQDIYLTGQPKITFFQAIYQRHTNFAMENIQQTVNGSAANNSRVSVTIARNGDLVGDMYVRLQPTVSNVTSNNTVFDTNWVAERALTDIELTIGGQRIDKHYQVWWRLYSELFLSESKKLNYGKMTTSPITYLDSVNLPSVYLPLLFFFNRHPGLYLPLIALQYHEVRLDFDIAPNFNNYFGTSGGAATFEVWANYVYLDTDERRRFAQKGHEYLIEQVQHTGGDSLSPPTAGAVATASKVSQMIRLSLNHPVKELIWCYQQADIIGNPNGMWNFSSNVSTVNITCTSNPVEFVSARPNAIGVPTIANHFSTPIPAGNIFYGWVEEGSSNVTSKCEVGPLYDFKLILNGQDRFKEQSGKYFNQYQPYQYHSGAPYPGIYCYSFALEPESHQPSGTCNFSRIDNAQVLFNLKGNYTTAVQKIFAVNYNILRIQSGMGGLAFSN